MDIEMPKGFQSSEQSERLNVKILDGKKFMWDGKTYDTEEEAREVISGYGKEGFETRMLEEEGKYLAYTRRVVTEVIVEGEAPP